MKIDPQIKRGRKFDQVISGARDIFMRDGFDGASVDDIAQAAGVSKATLYSYFPDKRMLFVEVTRVECNRMADRALEMESDCCEVREALLNGARLMVSFLTSPFLQRVFRICVAEADRFPELGHAFYASGPKMAQDRLITYFREAVAAGALNIDDYELAADQFTELCKADVFQRLVFGMIDKPTEVQTERIAQAATDMFLARYGV